jgi:hypothetical protein
VGADFLPAIEKEAREALICNKRENKIGDKLICQSWQAEYGTGAGQDLHNMDLAKGGKETWIQRK